MLHRHGREYRDAKERAEALERLAKEPRRVHGICYGCGQMIGGRAKYCKRCKLQQKDASDDR